MRKNYFNYPPKGYVHFEVLRDKLVKYNENFYKGYVCYKWLILQVIVSLHITKGGREWQVDFSTKEAIGRWITHVYVHAYNNRWNNNYYAYPSNLIAQVIAEKHNCLSSLAHKIGDLYA